MAASKYDVRKKHNIEKINEIRTKKEITNGQSEVQRTMYGIYEQTMY